MSERLRRESRHGQSRANLYQRTRSLSDAILTVGPLLDLRGRAFLTSEVPATLCAALGDGTLVRGESALTASGGRIERIWLDPDSPPASVGVLEAIESADAIVLGPGSLYTSLLPNLLVGGVIGAIRRSSAAKILICNLMTQPGETDGFFASDHLREVNRYLRDSAVDFCVLNSSRVFSKRYWQAGAEPVRSNLAEIRALGAIPIETDLAMTEARRIRHHPGRLAKVVLEIARQHVLESAARVRVVTQEAAWLNQFAVS